LISTGLLTASAATGLSVPAIAKNEDIRMGWFGALTGPNASPAIGFGRGIKFAVNAINGSGGVNGRKIDLVIRDTQGVPSKGVNAAQELVSKKVNAIFGPTNSGVALATTPILARYNMPDIHPCVLDELINPQKYPQAFRMAPSNTQWEEAAQNYCLDILKAKKVAVIGDATGYGITAMKDQVARFKKAGTDVVYKASIDPAETNLKPNLLHARDAGAEVVVVWSDSSGLNARLCNTRGSMNWDVPFVGHPAMASGDIKHLLHKPEYWEKVYVVGYKSCSYDSSGNLPQRSQELMGKLKGKVEVSDTLFWWVACGVDAVHLIAKAVAKSGPSKDDIIAYWNSLDKYPGYFGDYSFSKTQHNGYPTSEIVMSKAASARNGTFQLAPGYK
jgi:branched-chain amino acid transport system substrate-binding protein